MKKSTKVLSVLLSGFVAFSAVPLSALAANDDNTVRIIVENQTLSTEDGASWEGVLLDETIEVDDTSTIMTLLMQALDKHGYTQVGADKGYVTEINGLNQDDDDFGGWMATLDDWITDEGLSAYTIRSGKLEAGDEIRFQYTCAWGADIGYDWTSKDTTLKTLGEDKGTLSPEFISDNTEYVLTLPSDAETVSFLPVAANKGFRVKVYEDEYTPAEKGTELNYRHSIDVENDRVVYIGVANTAWMNYVPDGVSETVYKVTLKQDQPESSVEESSAEESSQVEESSEESREVESEKEVTATAFEYYVQNTADFGKYADAVVFARNNYNHLSDTEKAKVNAETYQTLTDAEKNLFGQHLEQTALSDVLVKNIPTVYAGAPLAGNEWQALIQTRSNQLTDEQKVAYLQSVKEYVADIGSAKLSGTRATDNARFVIALTSMGIDAQDIDGYNLIEPLADYDYVTGQGVNGAMFTLIALDTHNYEIPTAPQGTTQTTRENLIDAVLSAQLPDGGWTFFGTESDADMTAMAIQSLAKYYNTNDQVKTAVDKALTLIESYDYHTYSAESIAQLVIALTSVGINPTTDSRFQTVIENLFDNEFVYTGNLETALMSNYTDNQQFINENHAASGNKMTTEQAYMAITALYRNANGITSLYDMSDVTFAKADDENSDSSDVNSEVSEESKQESVQESSAESSADHSVSNGSSKDNVSSQSADTSDHRTVATGNNAFAVYALLAVLAVSGLTFAVTKKKSLRK